MFKCKYNFPQIAFRNENKHNFTNFSCPYENAQKQIMTATVETVSEQLDLASILPPDRAIARSITLSDADVGK